MGVSEFVFEYGSFVATVNYYITSISASCQAMIGVSYGATTLSFRHDDV